MTERDADLKRRRVRHFVPAWRWWTGFGITSAVAMTLTFLAYREDLPSWFVTGHQDKLWHFVIAGLLTFFLDGALKRRGVGPGRRIPLAAVVVLLPAALDEYVQRYATFRTSSLGDFAADAAGAAVFVWLSRRAAQ
jgi:VanZ family protein